MKTYVTAGVFVLALMIAVSMNSASAEQHCVETRIESTNGTNVHLVCEWDMFIPKGIDDTPDVEDEADKTGDPEEDPKGDPPSQDDNGGPDKIHPIPGCELDPEVDLNGDCLIDDAEQYKDDKKFFCEQTKKKPSEVEACRLLDVLDLCWRGVGETQPIQKNESFVTSRQIQDFDKAWNLGTISVLTKLKMAIEDCIAQEEKLPVMLGPRYENMRLATIFDGAVYHGDNPVAKIAEMIPWIQEEYANAILREEHLVLEAQTAFYDMCNLTQISDSSKKDLNCPAKLYDDTMYYQLSRLDLDKAKNEFSLQHNAAMNKFNTYDKTDGIGFDEDVIIFNTFGNWTGLE